MTDLNTLIGEVVSLDQQIDDLEKMLEEAQTARKELVEHGIPTALRALQSSQMTAQIGNREYDVRIAHKIVGSLSRAEDQDAALGYLAKKGFSGAANATISVTVPDEMREEVTETLNDLDPKVERKINHMTLAAFARECLQNGEAFDLEKVGLTSLSEAKIKEKT